MTSINKKTFLKLFFLQLFDIGYSTGSLFSEILGIFRTFQRFSASKSFSTRFSDQCLKMFEWAKNIYNQILSSIPMDPLTDFELFYTYTFAFPLMMLIFISTLSSGYIIFYYFLLFGLFLAFGIGIGFFGVNLTIAISVTVVSGILIIVGYIFRKKTMYFQCFLIFDYFILFKDKEKRINIDCCHMVHIVQFSFALIISLCVFSLIIIPILEYRTPLMWFIIIIITALFVLCSIIEGIVQCCWKANRKKKFDKLTVKAISFLTNCFTLLIIPSTDYFVKIMKETYKNSWNCIISYVGVGLILPITLIYLMIIYGFSDITEKYNIAEYGFFNYYYIEIIDVTKQVTYALLAAYDVYYGCILLEFFWVILILVLFPYRKKSEYFLSLGNSLIMFISNGAMIYSTLKNNAVFSNAVSIGFVVVACIPAVASLYVYFIYDFEVEIDTEKESDELIDIHESQNKLDQSEVLSDNENPPNQLEQLENDDNSMNQKIENDDNSMNQKIDNDDNSMNQKIDNDDNSMNQKIDNDDNSMNQKIENDDNSLNQQTENDNNTMNQQNQLYNVKFIKALESIFCEKDTMVGNDNMTDNIANSIKAITPIVFLFYGLSISLFSKNNRL